MFIRTRSTIIGLIILCVSLTFVVGCDRVQRHKVLTFFFDGVPPLAGETEEGTLGKEEVDLEDLWAGELAERPQTVWFVHEPGKDCNRCHKRLESAQWALPQFVKPLPELCYDCHSDYTVSAAIVHGPVAVGQCLFCHNPHKSRNEHLLKKPEPELCYLCHDTGIIESIPDHSSELSSECSNCHEAHASSAKSRLKADWKEKAN